MSREGFMNNNNCIEEVLSLLSTQIKAEAKFQKDKYQEIINRSSKTECLSLLETVTRKEMARENLRAFWRGAKKSNDINLKVEQELKVRQLLHFSESQDIAALRLQLIQAVKDSLVQDFMVIEWLTEGGAL